MNKKLRKKLEIFRAKLVENCKIVIKIIEKK
jgi:hypothetical protein